MEYDKDPGYNVRGGKFNVFGRSSKKPKNSGPQRDDEAWSKGAKIATCVVIGFVLLNGGFKGVTDTLANIVDFLKPKSEVVDTVKTKNVDDLNTVGYKKVDIDIDYDDVQDILETLLEDEDVSKEDSISNISFENVELVDYSAFENEKKFTKMIGKNLKNYENSVTFLSIADYSVQSDAFNQEFERVSQIIANAEKRVILRNIICHLYLVNQIVNCLL